MKTILISKQIHCGFASYQTGDVFVNVITTDKKLDFKPVLKATIVSKNFPMLNGEVITEITGDKQFQGIYVKADETFYQKQLGERKGLLGGGYAKTPEFEKHVELYKNLGWNLKENCKAQKAFWKREEKKYRAKSKAEGLVLWMGYEKYKGHPEYFQGGFSDEVFNSPSLKNYVGNGSGVYGWIGHSARKPELDKVIEDGLRERGLSDEAMHNWLTSGDGRHFADSIEGMKTSEQIERIKKYLNSMFNLCLIYGSTNHKGTMESSEEIRADFEKQGILLPEDKSYDQNGYMKLLAMAFAADALNKGTLPKHLEAMLPKLMEDVKKSQ